MTTAHSSLPIKESWKSLKLSHDCTKPYLACEVEDLRITFDTPHTGGGPYYVASSEISRLDFSAELVRRWNAHDAMREALEALIEQSKDHPIKCNDGYYGQHLRCKCAIAQTKAALAWASGTQEEKK